MTAALSDHSLDQIFRSARTFNGWANRPVEDATVREIYDLMKWGPTSANCRPARFVWVRSADGKATLAGLAAEPNKQKILKAPVTVIIGHDLDFACELPKLLPHACGARRGRGDGNAQRNAARRLPHRRCASVGTGLRPHVWFRQRWRG